MSNAMTRTRSGERFYNPPPMKRQQHQLLLQKQLQRPFITENRIDSAEIESRPDSDDSTLCMSNSVSTSPAVNLNLTNLDRLMESVTPVVPAQCLAEARLFSQKTREADALPFFCLGDLWESFKEWSVYGAGVPLLLNGNDIVKQYYVPSLSGIQLYLDPSMLRRRGGNIDAESSRVMSGAGSSDCEAETQAKGGANGLWSQHNLMNLNLQGVQRLSLRDKPLHSSNNATEISSSHGLLVYEYLEQEQPHHRKPLYDKVSSLASQFPDIKIYRSCDLLPGSWVSVAWYPIYRIPMGPTLQNLDASFLTFHSLSTKARSKNQVQFEVLSDRKAYSMIALPVFGLASYKLRGSILTLSGAHEREQASSLMQAADTWLRSLEVNLPDFQFFVSHNS